MSNDEISPLFEKLKIENEELAQALDATIESFAQVLDIREGEAVGHTRRVTTMTLALSKGLGIGDADLVHIKRGALLHDIGKMGISETILRKPGSLTPEEWVIMHMHPQYAYDYLSPIQYLYPALDIPYAHHEKWNGGGYPRGLNKELIPWAARIFAVVDVWDALTSRRSFREAWSEEKAREYIQGEAGVQFDPAIVKAFLQLEHKIRTTGLIPG